MFSISNLIKMDAAEAGQDMDYPAQQSIAYQVYFTAGFCLTLIVVFSLIRLLTKIYFGPRTIKMDESENPSTSLLDFTKLTSRP